MTTSRHSAAAHQEEETDLVGTVQSLVVAFALAMTVRSYVTEGFVIPTGSMAPTLMGAHTRIESDATGYSYPVDTGPAFDIPAFLGREFLQYPREICDPMISNEIGYRIGETTLGAIQQASRSGDRVLVLKFLYPFREPERWDVVVFKNPTDPTGDAANFIKRLVGLPDEQLLMLDGDVFTAPLGADRSAFTIERKPEHVQRAVWQEVHSSDYMPVDPASLAKSWSREWRGAPWATKGLDLGPKGNARAWRHDGAGAAELVWQYDLLPINDRAPYNIWRWQTEPLPKFRAATNPFRAPDPAYSVSDVRVSAAIEAEKPEALRTRYELGTRKRVMVYEIADGKATVRIERERESDADAVVVLGEASAEFEVPASGHPFAVEFWHVDQQLSLWVNGRRVVELDYAFDSLEERLTASFNGRVVEDYLRAPTAQQPTPPSLRIAMEGSPFTLHRVRVDRDLYYRPGILDISERNQPSVNGLAISGAAFGTDFNRPAQLQSNQFMMCGDNSGASRDSRLWGRPSPLVKAVFDDETMDAPFVVPRALLLGKAWCVYFPAAIRPSEKLPAVLPDFGQLRFIR